MSSESSTLMDQMRVFADKPEDASDITSMDDAKKELAALRRLFTQLVSAAQTNAAFVFIKPHALTEKVKNLVKDMLLKAGLVVESEGHISAEDIQTKKLIDNHYYAIASKATLTKPKDLPVPADKFEEKFGEKWSSVLEKGNVYNAVDAAEYLGLDAAGLEVEWRKCKPAGKVVKFGGGFYCALIDTVEGKEPIYTFNGFFMSMREKYTVGAGIYYYSVSWDKEKTGLSWSDFRGKLLGPTNPADAPNDSIRGTILQGWKDLGLAAEPNTGDNGVHASASPFEGLSERMNWLQAELRSDIFGGALLREGLSDACVKSWCRDPVLITDKNDTRGSLFDSLEDSDASDCLRRCREIYALNRRTEAEAASKTSQ